MKRRRTNESTIHIPDGSYRSEHRRGNSLRSEPRLPKINLPDSGGSAQRLCDVLIYPQQHRAAVYIKNSFTILVNKLIFRPRRGGDGEVKK